MSRYLDITSQVGGNSGQALAGATLSFYEAPATSTWLATYQDEDLTLPNTNPVVADGEGRFPDIWLQAQKYYVELHDAAGNLLDAQNNVTGLIISGASTLANIAALTALMESALLDGDVFEVDGYYAQGDGGGGRFWWDSDNTDTANGGTIIAPDVTDGTGRWLRIYDSGVYATWFGVKKDDTDTTTEITAFRDFIAANPTVQGIFSEGTYQYSVSPNWAIEKMEIVFDGEVTFHNTGTGPTLILDAGTTGQTDDYQFGWGNKVNLLGDASSTHGMYCRAQHRCKIGVNVRGCGTTSDAALIEFSVVAEFDIHASVNDFPFVTKPLRGIVCTRRTGGSQELSSANIFYNPVIEGVGGVGITFDYCTMNTVIGGTSEGNTGDNVVCTENSRTNMFIKTDFEVATSGVGIRDGGRRNRYFDCFNDDDVIFEQTSEANILEGGQHDNIYTLGERAKLHDVDYGVNGGEIIQEFTGTHDGGADAAILTDTTASFLPDDLVGLTVSNITDGSTATITANTSTTVTGTLSGGAEDDWDVSDAYKILGDVTSSITDCYDVQSGLYKQVNKVQGRTSFTKTTSAGAVGDTLTVPGDITKEEVPLLGVKIGDNVTLTSQTVLATGFQRVPVAICTEDDKIDITFSQLTGSVSSPLPSGGTYTVTVNGK